MPCGGDLQIRFGVVGKRTHNVHEGGAGAKVKIHDAPAFERCDFEPPAAAAHALADGGKLTDAVGEWEAYLKLAPDGRVRWHRDYWDAAGELYEKLPVIGAVMRWLKHRMG